MSTNRGVEAFCFSCKSSSIFQSQMISLVAWAAATYLASVVESTGTDCLCDLQLMAVDPTFIEYPEVETPFYLSPSKSESE